MAIGGWLLSAGAAIIITVVVASIAVAAGWDLDRVQVALIPTTPVVAMVVALFIAASVPQGSVRLLFGPGRVLVSRLPIALACGVGAFLVVNVGFSALIVFVLGLMGAEAPEVQAALRDAMARPESLPIVAVSTMVLAPLGEELLYRGLLFQALLRRFRPAVAVWWSSALFAIMHVDVTGSPVGALVTVLLILPLGVLLAWAFLRTRTLWVPILIHAGFNAVTVLYLISVGV